MRAPGEVYNSKMNGRKQTFLGGEWPMRLRSTREFEGGRNEVHEIRARVKARRHKLVCKRGVAAPSRFNL